VPIAQETQISHARLMQMDEADVGKLHWKIMFISGMGFFTDAYDLFVIGVVMSMLKEGWHPSAVQVELVTSTALLESAVGALLFGRVADMLGRKRIYGYECLVLAMGAVASALSPNIVWLIISVLLSASVWRRTSRECDINERISGQAHSRNAGEFDLRDAGILIFGPLLAAALLATPLSHDMIWRLLLAFGGIPAMVLFHARRSMHETPRFLLAAGRHDEFNEAISFIDNRTPARAEGCSNRCQSRKEARSPENLVLG
jgi:PHS family inorganic phosphate transporter-like MFS transporter